MYASVWNRIVLLAAGLAAGWNLVDLLASAGEERVRRRWRVAVSLVVGLSMIALIDPRARVMGAFTLGLSASVAYLARARQFAHPVLGDAPDSTDLASGASGRRCLLLTVLGEPAEYEGADPWRWWIANAPDGPSVSWLRIPAVLRRVRRCYVREGTPPLHLELRALAENLARRVTPGTVVRSLVWSGPGDLVEAIASLAEVGCTDFLIYVLTTDPVDAFDRRAAEVEAAVLAERGSVDRLDACARHVDMGSGWARISHILCHGRFRPLNPMDSEAADAVARELPDSWLASSSMCVHEPNLTNEQTVVL